MPKRTTMPVYRLYTSTTDRCVLCCYADGLLVGMTVLGIENEEQAAFLSKNMPLFFLEKAIVLGKVLMNGQEWTIDKPESPYGVPFDVFYSLYGKKVKPEKAKPIWDRLSSEDQLACLNVVKRYVRVSDAEFRPYPDTFLRNRQWEYEDLIPKPKPKYG